MNLRLKLVVVFATGTLLAFSFFGFIAYDTARSTNLKNEIELLAHVTPYIANHVWDDLERGKKWNPVFGLGGDISTDHSIYLFVTDRQGTIVSGPDVPKLQQIYEQIAALHASPDTRSGSLRVKDSLYLWSRTNIPKTGYEAMLIRHSRSSAAYAFFREMGVSLIVTAIILLWFATLAAMYIAGLFEKLEEQKSILRHRSLHDVLTGLPNRALLNDRLQQMIFSLKREPAQFGLCLLDLNGFKEVNDTLGYQSGDELLLEVAQRLRTNLRASDSVARIGGDEFALVLCKVDSTSAKAVAEKLMQYVEQPAEIKNHTLRVSGSVGIALFPDHGADIETLFKNADVAMYAAKRSGTRIEVYGPEFAKEETASSLA